MASQDNGRNAVRTLCLVSAFLAPLMTAAPARTEIISLRDMMRGISMTPQQCAATPLTVWVNTSSGGYCMRYYLSTVGGEGRWPVVFLQGDRLGVANLKTRTFEGNPKETDINTDELQRAADTFSKKAGGPAIYLARIGVEGSSGYAIVRHTVLELQVTNAALNGIKQRHQYEGFHLFGQSGGATLVGGLLGLRQDIGCAVPGSGRLALMTISKRRADGDPGRTTFDPSESAAWIARSRARILVVTDPDDKKVPLKDQSTFVERLRRAGGQAEQLFVQATDENHHGTTNYSATVVSGCIRGEGTQTIAQNLAEQVRTRLAAAKAKADKAIAEAARRPLPASQQLPAPAPGQVAQLSQPPMSPAYQGPRMTRPSVQTAQTPSSPTTQMSQPQLQPQFQPQPRLSSSYQPQVPTAQYPQRMQIPAGYPQYRQPLAPTYQAQARIPQPIYPQVYPPATQYQAGYPQARQPSRPGDPAQARFAQPIYPQQGLRPNNPGLASPTYVPPQSTYQHLPNRPAPLQAGNAAPPVLAPPAQPSNPTI